MKRNRLRDLLQAYTPTAKEGDAKERMLAFIEKYPNCFERSLEIGHITASAWLLNKAGTHAMLMHHKKLDMWVQPGGHCDGESDVLSVALKEAQEESGILGIEPVIQDIYDIDIHKIPQYKEIPSHYHFDVRFLMQVKSDEQLVQNDESHELGWFSKDREKLPTSEPTVLRMHEKWCAR